MGKGSGLAMGAVVPECRAAIIVARQIRTQPTLPIVRPVTRVAIKVGELISNHPCMGRLTSQCQIEL